MKDNQIIWLVVISHFTIILLFIIGLFEHYRENSFTKDSCSEIDEICQEDFNRLCDLTCPELGYATKEYVEWLEKEADTWGDTWRESDCGIQISEENDWWDIDNNLSEIKEELRCKDGKKVWNITFYYGNGMEAERYKQQFCS